MRLAEGCHRREPQKGRGVDWQKPCKSSKITSLGGNKSICAIVQVQMNLENLLHAPVAVKVDHVGGSVGQDVTAGLREGTLPSSPALVC